MSERAKPLEELVLRFLDGELSDDELAALDAAIEADAGARELFSALLEQEGALRGLGAGERPDLSAATVRRIRQQLSARVQEGVMEKIRTSRGPAGDETTRPPAPSGESVRAAPVEGRSVWLGRRFVFLAAAAIVAVWAISAIDPIEETLVPVPEHELSVYGLENATPGMPLVYRAAVRNGRSGEALAGVTTRFALVDAQGRTAWEAEQRTDDEGLALVEPTLPEELAEGTYSLVVRADRDDGPLEVTRPVQVRRSFRLFLSTDKPRYQPGQVIHLRTLALYAMDRRPVTKREVTLCVRDARGNKVFTKRVQTSRFGLASADFQLADQVNEGEFQVEATLGDTASQRSVTVEPYRLPRFRIELSTDKAYYAPGETVTGELSAQYTYGQPVAGAKVSVVASEFVEAFRPFGNVEGTTDGEGRFRFELPLKESFVGVPLKQGDGVISFEAKVTDQARYSQERTLERTVTTTPLRVDVVPESGELAPGVENTLYLVTSAPDGQPVQARVEIAAAGVATTVVETDASGFGELRWPAGAPAELELTFTDAAGREARARQSLHVDVRGQDALLLRTDRATYRAGDSARLSVLTAAAASRAFVDVIKDGQTVLTRAVDLADGRGELVLDLPADLSGTLAISCYRLLRSGEIASDTRLVQVAEQQDLEVTATLDREVYRPAETATVQLQVRRGADPTVAALSLVGVDEAVFALQESRPGLERVYFALQEELLEPRYEIHGQLAPAALVDPPASSGDSGAAVMLAAARGADGPAGASAGTYAERLLDHDRRVSGAMRDLWAVVALTPSFVYFFLLLQILVYAARRVARHEAVPASGEQEAALARRRLRWLVALWALAFWVPPAGAAIGSEVVGYPHEEAAASMVGVSSIVAFLVVLSLLARALRRAAPSGALPDFRRAIGAIPWAYLCWLLALVALFVAGSADVIEEEWIVLDLLATFLLAALAAGAISLSGASALRARSRARLLWIGASRFVLAALPAALLAFVTLGVRSAETLVPAAMAPPPAINREAMVDRELEPTDSSDAGAPLQAPTRVRRHFPETLLWRPEVVTDAQGRATVEVPLADSITTWRLGVGAVSADGLLGSSTVGIRVFQPFFVDVDLPLSLTQHDEVQLTVGVYSYLDAPQTVRIDLDAADWLEVRGGPATRTLSLGPRQITQVTFPVIARTPGEHPLTVRASGSEMADAVERRVRVAPDGQPVVDTRNGELRPGQPVTQDFTIPPEAIAGASDLVLKVYPGAFSQVVEGLEGILQMPSGCFEQTSSSTYPNVLVLGYLRQNRMASPEVELRALEYINTGYQRLLSYEVDGGGFEWFGHAPAHTVLTAYGLMEFSDMAEVFEVDRAVIDRTREWLFSQQRPDGSFVPTQGGIAEGAINAYQGQTLRTTAYVAWALGESGDRDARLDRALAFLEANVASERDPYTLAVAANALLAGGRRAETLLRRLDEMKVREGRLVHWPSQGEGATYSRGEALDVETTAIAVHAFLRARVATDTAHEALAWLVSVKDSSGTWQSTQATVHAMRALLLGTGDAADVEGEVGIDVVIGGQVVERLTVTEETADVFHTLGLGEHLRPGSNQVRLDVRGAGSLAYQLVATHYVPWRAGERGVEPPLSIDVAYDATTLAVGDVLTARATIRYNRPGAAQMTLVDLGVPPGFTLETDGFDAMQEAGQIERYTATDRQVILYFREIRGDRPVTFAYRLRARFPLRVQAPRSSAYAYYEPEVRDETEPVALTVR